MYGTAMACDVCGHTELTTSDDEWAVPQGWARIHLNQTVDWRFAEKQKTTLVHLSVDCCSLSCVYAMLGEAKERVK